MLPSLGRFDGHSDSRSWNCGIKGPTDDQEVNALRAPARDAISQEARIEVTALALRVIADRLEHGEPVPFDPAAPRAGRRAIAFS
jgi:glycogen operon protein